MKNIWRKFIKIYGNDTATSSNTEAAVQAGPNYDVAVATTEPNYNYSSEEAVEADSQYVNVEPTYKYDTNNGSSC